MNCRGVMGSGIALQVKEKYPEVYFEYLELINNHKLGEDLRHTLLGRVHSVKVSNLQFIVNIFGQNYYGRDKKQYTDTEALFKAFKQIRHKAEQLDLSVAMPYKIGCYRGGADWDEVENLLLIAFDSYKVTLYKYDEEEKRK